MRRRPKAALVVFLYLAKETRGDMIPWDQYVTPLAPLKHFMVSSISCMSTRSLPQCFFRVYLYLHSLRDIHAVSIR